MNTLALFASMDPMAQAQAEFAQNSAQSWMNGDSVVAAFGAVVIALLFVTWAVFVRKPNRTVAITPEEAAASLIGNKAGRRRKQHRYPTLAERGGLPPVKSKN